MQLMAVPLSQGFVGVTGNKNCHSRIGLSHDPSGERRATTFRYLPEPWGFRVVARVSRPLLSVFIPKGSRQTGTTRKETGLNTRDRCRDAQDHDKHLRRPGELMVL